MNEPSAICTVAILIVTTFASLIGFHDPFFREKYLFSVREILAEKQYYRLVTSAFLHADWMHLLLNLVTLYLFGRIIESVLGAGQFLLIYFTAIVGGDLLSLWIHRHHEYRAYGASGGVCGILFSYVLLAPNSDLSFFLFPVWIPAWLYAILYLVATFVAIKRQSDGIGHDAHLGGAILGFWTAAVLHPWLVRENLKTFLAISILAVLLFVYLAKNPLFLPPSTSWRERPHRKTRGNGLPKHKREAAAVDAVLDKISREGIGNLTAEEKALLNSTSEKYRRRAESRKPDSGLTI